jgi:hypothetical protein
MSIPQDNRYTLEWFKARGASDHTRKPAARVTLRKHQKEGSNAVVSAHSSGLPGFLLADDVGLGKTYTIIDAVCALAKLSKKPLNVLVISPLSVVPHWKHSLNDYGTTNTFWCVTNYDILKNFLSEPSVAKTAKKVRTRNKRVSKYGLSKHNWDIVICDESHRLKNPVSQRTRCVQRLVSTNRSGVKSVPAFTIWASATAGQNPLDLSYLARLFAARTHTKASTLANYETWCQANNLGVSKGKFGKWEYAPNDADYERVRSLLFDEFTFKTHTSICSLRRKPSMIASWPEISRQSMPVELTTKNFKAYQLAWETFLKEMSIVNKSKGKDSKNAMVVALRFRQKASILRAQSTALAIKDSIAEGYRPAVSVQFYDSIDAIVSFLPKTFKVGVIDGRVSAKNRETIRTNFQKGKLDCILFSVTEGISLHANSDSMHADTTPRMLLIHDLRWSALDMAQIEGRTHRDGQAAVAYYMYSEYTVEEKMVNSVLSKLKTMGDMLGDDTTALDALLEECLRASA